MRLSAALFLFLVLAGSASGATGSPELRSATLDSGGQALLGSAFRPHERIAITGLGEKIVVRADRRGRFAVKLPGPVRPACAGLVRAVGSRGSSVTLLRQGCVPPPRYPDVPSPATATT